MQQQEEVQNEEYVEPQTGLSFDHMFGRNDYINLDTEGGNDTNADPVLDNDEQQQEPQPGVR